MSGNSGSKQNKNNNRNPTLRDHERMHGRSGHAIHDKDVSATTGKDDAIGQGGGTSQSSSGGQTMSRDSGHN
jgi:hypothetical protein